MTNMTASRILKWLDIIKISKLGGTNNVEVTFRPSLHDNFTPLPVVIGRKQLVLKLEDVVKQIPLPSCASMHAIAACNAEDARQHLCPKSLI
jgi:hypothetical protein